MEEINHIMWNFVKGHSLGKLIKCHNLASEVLAYELYGLLLWCFLLSLWNGALKGHGHRKKNEMEGKKIHILVLLHSHIILRSPRNFAFAHKTFVSFASEVFQGNAKESKRIFFTLQHVPFRGFYFKPWQPQSTFTFII